MDGATGSLNSLFGIIVNQPSLIFYFDANGDKKPNRIGKEIYVMVYVPDRGLIPAGSDKTVKEVEQNCLNGNGYWCLHYIKSNGWQISDKVWKNKFSFKKVR